VEVLARPDIGLPKPSIDPTRAGGVQLSWERGPRYLELELAGPNGASLYFADAAMGREDERTVPRGTPG
jgi:hypothetical protein